MSSQTAELCSKFKVIVWAQIETCLSTHFTKNRDKGVRHTNNSTYAES